jgi:hypothetical protein
MTEPQITKTKSRSRRWLTFTGMAILILAGVAIALLARKWPFTRERVSQSLEEAVYAKVQFANFHSTYFPHPGCTAEGVVFVRGSNPPGTWPFISIQKLTIQARYADLFFRPGYIARMVAEQLQVHVPARGSGSPSAPSSLNTGGSNTRIGELVANGALLEVARKAGKPPLRFQIHLLTAKSVSRDKPLSYTVALLNALPPGEIHSSGHFGPWNSANPAQTPVSGSYKFEQANLGVFHGIAGTLSSEGKFQGSLGQMECQGKTDVPDFKVTRTDNTVHLTTEFQATVNGLNGDVRLSRVDASFLRTRVSASGTIAGHPGQHGKTASLDLTINDGRIQDVLHIFIQHPRAPVTGVVSFRAHATILPLGRPFLNELILTGDFGVGGGLFTKPETQAKVDRLSAHAQGEKVKNDDDPETVISDLSGHVLLKDGVATFSDLSFRVPGAEAKMRGTFNLLSQKVDLHGTLRTEAEFSKTTTGVKSVLLKPFNVFFKKKHAGAVIPVYMTGKYPHPQAGIDLIGKKNGEQKSD